MLRILSIFVLSVISAMAHAQLAGISNTDAASGLRQALGVLIIASLFCMPLNAANFV